MSREWRPSSIIVCPPRTGRPRAGRAGGPPHPRRSARRRTQMARGRCFPRPRRRRLRAGTGRGSPPVSLSRHRVARRVVSTKREASFRSFTAPMLSCGLRCRPPSRGGSAIDAPSGAGPQGADRIDHRSHPPRHPRHPHPRRRLARRGRGAVHRGRVQPLRGRPARPQGSADQPRFRAADDRLRPDRQGRARPPRLPQPRARHVRPDPGRDARRDDRHRGQGLLGQPGLRPGRHRVAPASTRSPAGRAARRRSPSSSSARGCCRPRRSRARPTSARSARSSSPSA